MRSAYDQHGDRKSSSKYLLDMRNHKWIPFIKEVIQQKPCFFAFGAAHLAGENGIIQLLRQKGYTVEPVIY